MGAAAAGGLAALGAGGAYVVTDRQHRWIAKILSRSLPGYSFEPGGLARFIAEYTAKERSSMKERILAAAQGLVDAKAVLPEQSAARLAERERKILSDFLVGSDFFENYPDGPTLITYRGAPTVCVSPFARF